MENSYILQRFRPKLDSPVFVEGLPGFGNVGKIAAQLLIQFSEARLFAEYYSPFFPDYVVVSGQGICDLPRYKFYASSSGERLSVVVLTGDSQPPLDNVVAHYEICEEILDFVQKLGCDFIVTVGGVPVSSERKDVYVAATSNELAAEVMGKGGIIYGKGRIMGATGLLLGLAKERGLDGICLLGTTNGLQSDKDAGFSVFKLLMKVLGREVQ
ncbi:MAG: PAC2 family protein [Candidatus Bathyarchaeia archaeon]